ncbi:BadF/BadG/BcrA/BcrD ATPase family protein [Marinovum sp.]|uniref:BadF/BadG/BcrA/BcrD ATPase family protein n=1 Tax=Marinovum sp. TaxID=2024839 RepID=UPI002B270C4E|nr:BadF/BadG/BcrA/BcrD ATPase family protein [Marinovum sp.]
MQDQPRYLAGIDGGGSGCRAAIADAAGRVLGRGAAGPANVTSDSAQAVANANTALAQAVMAAGLDAGALAQTALHAGLAGVLDDAMAAEVAARLPTGLTRVSDDRRTTALGALGSRAGVLAAIGTGSTLAAVRDGGVKTLGGWGLILGDQASGAWLGRGLCAVALLCVDRLQDHSPLTETLLAEHDTDPGRLVRFAAAATPADFAALAPRVVRAAATGDAQARSLMQAGADYLAQAFKVLRLGGADVLCLTGGLGPHYADYLPAGVQARIAPPEGDALDGALRLAARIAQEASR